MTQTFHTTEPTSGHAEEGSGERSARDDRYGPTLSPGHLDPGTSQVKGMMGRVTCTFASVPQAVCWFRT